MPQSQIEALLRTRIGLNPESIGAQSIAAAMRARMAAHGDTDPAVLHERLQSDSVEFLEMVEWASRQIDATINIEPLNSHQSVRARQQQQIERGTNCQPQKRSNRQPDPCKTRR